MVSENLPTRKNIRLQGYDYALAGGYFVTLSTHKKQPLFGEIVDMEVVLNEIGELVKECWLELPNHHPDVILDEYIVMPDHLHGILFINRLAVDVSEGEAGNQKIFAEIISSEKSVSTQANGAKSDSLGAIIAGFKSCATRKIRQQLDDSAIKIWQRNYYDRIIRDEKELAQIRAYVRYNAVKQAVE